MCFTQMSLVAKFWQRALSQRCTTAKSGTTTERVTTMSCMLILRGGSHQIMQIITGTVSDRLSPNLEISTEQPVAFCYSSKGNERLWSRDTLSSRPCLMQVSPLFSNFDAGACLGNDMLASRCVLQVLCRVFLEATCVGHKLEKRGARAQHAAVEQYEESIFVRHIFGLGL